jgi:hypothetical protein
MTCCQCGALDVPRLEAAPDPTAPPIVTHHVQIEIQWLKQSRPLQPREVKAGWRVKGIFQGRFAIERDICMDCLNSNYIRRQLNAEHRKKALALEQDKSAETNFYFALCDMDGAY